MIKKFLLLFGSLFFLSIHAQSFVKNIDLTEFNGGQAPLKRALKVDSNLSVGLFFSDTDDQDGDGTILEFEDDAMATNFGSTLDNGCGPRSGHNMLYYLGF